jgi:hypothetical protein
MTSGHASFARNKSMIRSQHSGQWRLLVEGEWWCPQGGRLVSE